MTVSENIRNTDIVIIMPIYIYIYIPPIHGV
jgi:hypothetical protein